MGNKDIQEEKELLGLTKDLWNKFVKLEPQHLSERPEFGKAIHELQMIIGMRILRKEHPEIFPIHKTCKKP